MNGGEVLKRLGLSLFTLWNVLVLTMAGVVGSTSFAYAVDEQTVSSIDEAKALATPKEFRAIESSQPAGTNKEIIIRWQDPPQTINVHGTVSTVTYTLASIQLRRSENPDMSAPQLFNRSTQLGVFSTVTDQLPIPESGSKTYYYQAIASYGGNAAIGGGTVTGLTEIWPFKVNADGSTTSGVETGVVGDQQAQLSGTQTWNESASRYDVSLTWIPPKQTPTGYTVVRSIRRQGQPNFGPFQNMGTTSGTTFSDSISIDPGATQETQYAIKSNYSERQFDQAQVISNSVTFTQSRKEDGSPEEETQTGTIGERPNIGDIAEDTTAFESEATECNTYCKNVGEKISNPVLRQYIVEPACEILCYIYTGALDFLKYLVTSADTILHDGLGRDTTQTETESEPVGPLAPNPNATPAPTPAPTGSPYNPPNPFLNGNIFR